MLKIAEKLEFTKGGQRLHKNRNYKESGVQKSGPSYKSARKLPRK
jgi:hypothetical protein